jgi:hypothetical protein
MTQGWQSFTTGEVLSSNAMNQVAASTVNVFSSASARDAAIPGGSLAEGLICYLEDDNSIYTYSGAAWVINGTGTLTGITTSNGVAGSGTSGSVALTLDTDAKGDLLVGTGADTSIKLTVGTNTHVLTADSSTASGLVWSAPTTGDITEVEAGTNIDVTSGTGPVPSVALAIDAAVDIGADGSGVDVTFHSGTAGDSMLWDASDKALEFTDSKITLNDNLLETPEMLDYSESVNAIGATGGGTQDIDLTLGNVVTATVDSSANTFTFSNPSATGKSCSFTLILTNGGSQTVNWPAAVDFAGGSAPDLTTAGVDILAFMTIDAGTIWYGFPAGIEMS